MSRLVFILILLTMLTKGVAQKTSSQGSGIYLTEKDFLNNKVTLFAADDSFNHLERSLDDVIVTRSGQKYKMNKGTFYGYLQAGTRYRFYEDDTKSFSSCGYYKVIEESDVIIYSKVASTPKTGSHTWYYYSDKLDSPIKKLSVRSIKKVPEEVYPVLLKYAVLKSGKSFIPNN